MRKNLRLSIRNWSTPTVSVTRRVLTTFSRLLVLRFKVKGIGTGKLFDSNLNWYLPTEAPHCVFAQHYLATRIRTWSSDSCLLTRSLRRSRARIYHIVRLCTAASTWGGHRASITTTQYRVGTPSVPSGAGGSLQLASPKILGSDGLICLLLWSGGLRPPPVIPGAGRHSPSKEVISAVRTRGVITMDSCTGSIRGAGKDQGRRPLSIGSGTV